jgi:DNA polymerase III delta subunit-like protein
VTATGRTTALLDRLASRAERFPGAVLLVGSSAAALEREARRIARRLLCDCGREADREAQACDTCRRTAAGSHPDVLLVEPEGVSIKIDRVREALGFAAGRPYEAARRVVLLLHAEKLGVEAGNALLKALEEPGAHVHWVLATTRPESLLPTILSRCVTVPVPPPTRAERVAGWAELGFSDEDSEELARLPEDDEQEGDPAGRLARFRERRERVVQALHAGIAGGRPAPLVMLADEIGRAEARHPELLAEVLADAALAAAGSAERMRHRALAGPIAEIGRSRPGEALQAAAVRAADAPPDSRRGNRRLHFESLLLTLLLAKN